MYAAERICRQCPRPKPTSPADFSFRSSHSGTRDQCGQGLHSDSTLQGMTYLRAIIERELCKFCEGCAHEQQSLVVHEHAFIQLQDCDRSACLRHLCTWACSEDIEAQHRLDTRASVYLREYSPWIQSCWKCPNSVASRGRSAESRFGIASEETCLKCFHSCAA